MRELDERLGFGELIKEHLTDSRANNARFSFADLLLQSECCRLAGYEDVNKTGRLSQNSAFRLNAMEAAKYSPTVELPFKIAMVLDVSLERSFNIY